MKKVITLVICIFVLGLGALLGYWISGSRSAAEPVTEVAEAVALPKVVVYKSPTCGCCGDWVTHMQQEGFTVEVHDVDDVDPFKRQAGLVPKFASCHTAFVDGYALEGHVPAADVKRLLSERPSGRGLAVPGMPLGSPGMEVGDRRDAYDVLLYRNDGESAVFSHYPADR